MTRLVLFGLWHGACAEVIAVSSASGRFDFFQIARACTKSSSAHSSALSHPRGPTHRPVSTCCSTYRRLGHRPRPRNIVTVSPVPNPDTLCRQESSLRQIIKKARSPPGHTQSTPHYRLSSLVSAVSIAAMTYQYHLFSLPPELLDTLVPRNVLSAIPERPPSPQPQSSPPLPQSSAGSRACNICLGAAFVDVEDQRAHFRSDWHRYNVKVRLGGGQPVSEAKFAQLVDSMSYTLCDYIVPPFNLWCRSRGFDIRFRVLF